MSKSKVTVLDHGFIELIDHMGSDQRIVDSARVSVSGDKVKAVSTNEGLIRYCLRNFHWSPVEHCVVTFAVRLPIFVARQWMRHRDSYNEQSARYSVMKDDFYVPGVARMNVQAKDNHQGSDAQIVHGACDLVTKIEEFNEQAYRLYSDLEAAGLAREIARTVLPVSLYTQFYWTVDLRSLMNFMRLREDSHAQWEIRQYAHEIHKMVEPLFPLAIKAFEDYIQASKVFSAQEMEMLSEVLPNVDWISQWMGEGGKSLSKREKAEFLEKLRGNK